MRAAAGATGSTVRADAVRSGAGRTVAIGVLASVCFGVPLCLATVGGLPFAHVDPLLPVRRVMGGGVDTRSVMAWMGQVAVVIAWVGWSWTVTCVALEVRWRHSGRSPAYLPGSRTMQWAVAGLVGTALALGGVGRISHDLRPVGSGPVGAECTVPVVRPGSERPPQGPQLDGWSDVTVGKVVVDTPGWVPGPAAPFPAGSGGPGAIPVDRATGSPTVDTLTGVHLVSGRETLWSVAELRLGSARRWREVAEQNYGRPQSDGGRLGDDHWIRPGWELLLPSPGRESSTPISAVETIVPDDDVVAVEPMGTSRVVTPGDGRATHVVGGAVPPRCPLPQDTLKHPANPANPAIPSTPAMPVTPVGAGIVGVGVTELVDRLRRVQQRHREPGGRIRLPQPVLRQFEQRIRLGDGGVVLASVEDAVVQQFGGGPGAVVPMGLLGVKVWGTDVQFVFDGEPARDVPVRGNRRPDGPAAVGLGRVESSRRRESRMGADRSRFALPTLVTIGRSADRVVLVNLEGLGSVVLTGERRDTEGVARALALELATSRWSGAFDLCLVGFGADLERFERVSVTDAAGALAADLTWRRLRQELLLEDGGFASSIEARCRDGGSSWDPVVVICGPGVPADDAAALVGVGAERVGVAVLVVSDGVSDYGAARELRIGTGPVPSVPSLEVFGELLDPQLVSAADVDQVIALVETATDAMAGSGAGGRSERSEVPRSPGGRDGPGDGTTPRLPGPASEERPSGDPAPRGTSGAPVSPLVDRRAASSSRVGSVSGLRAGDRGPGTVPAAPRATGMAPPIEVEVAVLGPVGVCGAARPFTRAWALELVVFLAMHPDGASNEAWATALWPERLMAPSSLHSTASVARRSLGKARDGTDHLPRSHGRLCLATTVGTDWDRFLRMADSEDTDQWREALELVRGRPFDGLRSADWTILDGTAPGIESAIVDLSGRLAGACLRSGDPRGAEWAARRGLVVSPYDERLYRMLLRAADASGNPSGVESVMAELVRVVADEIEPVESVHPSTLALYRSLSRRRVPGP